MDLFEYQARSQGGWVMPGEAGCAFWPGITRLDVAGCGWAAVAVGSHLGSQLGCLLAEDGLAAGWSSGAACTHAVVVSVLTAVEMLIAARRLVGARPHLAAVAGIVHHEDLWQLRRDELTGIDVRIDGWDIRGRWFRCGRRGHAAADQMPLTR